MKSRGLYFAWIVACIGMISSLFFGEFQNREPCPLCWYQRIALFPLVIILGIAAFRHAYKIILYVLPLSLIGLGLAIYQMAALKLGLACKSCKVSEVSTPFYFPLLALIGFAILNVLLIWTMKLNRSSKKR